MEQHAPFMSRSVPVGLSRLRRLGVVMSTRCWRLRSLLVVATIALASSGCAWIQRANVDSSENPGSVEGLSTAISADGRYIVFDSFSPLVSGDTNDSIDVFMRDTAAGTTTRVSVDSAENQANLSSFNGAISANGRYVAFESTASNLVTGDTNRNVDVFVRDTVAGTTTRVSVSSASSQANNAGGSYRPAISANGRYVAFYSYATNLVAGDTNATPDVFVRDTVAGTTTRVNVDGAGNQANDLSQFPAISADGRYVGFNSSASNLVAGDTNNRGDVFLRDTVAGTTTLVSVDSAGNQAIGGSSFPALAADGRYVAFWSDASNLVAGDTNNMSDVFLRDTVAGTTTRVSVGSAGNEASDESSSPVISVNGRYVAFISAASNLVDGDTNNRSDVFVRDTLAGTTTRVSVDGTGNQANDGSYRSAISADGRYVAFISVASNLVPGATIGQRSVVVRANPEPTVSGITPSTLPRGATTPVAIAGSGFIPGAIVVIDGTDHTVSNVHVVSPRQLTANVTVGSDAALGARNVLVELPGTGPGFGAGALGVCAACVTVN
jgi:WD40-like Beta Propeller Repeat